MDEQFPMWLDVARANMAEHASYRALADPARTIDVSPGEVTRLCRMHQATKAARGAKHFDFGRVIEGDWDLKWQGQRNIVLEEMTTHRSVFMHYVEGLPWEETPVFGTQLKRIKTEGVADHGMSSYADLVERCRALDDIFADMRRSGYRLRAFEDCLSVSITRTGGFLLGEGGKHRLAMAQLLRLQTIKVYVLSRHARWQRVRERVAVGDIDMEHPDLTDLK